MTLCMAEILPRLLKRDADAVAFIMTIHEVADTWDDLVDRDKPVSAHEINAAFFKALIILPSNIFYKKHEALFLPLMEATFYDWMTANRLEERCDQDALRTAYVLRCSAMMMTVMAARIIGGPDWAVTVNTELRMRGDSWRDYKTKHEVNDGLDQR